MELQREKRKKHLLMELAHPPIIASKLQQTVIIHAVEGKRERERVGRRKSSEGASTGPEILCTSQCHSWILFGPASSSREAQSEHPSLWTFLSGEQCSETVPNCVCCGCFMSD